MLAVVDPSRAAAVDAEIAETYGGYRGARPWTHRVTAASAAREVVDP